MEQIKYIASILENSIYPFRDKFDNPSSFPLSNDTKLVINRNFVAINSHMFTSEHLSITATSTGTMVEHPVFLKGDYLDSILDLLSSFRDNTLKKVISPEFQKEIISNRIAELQKQLQECG